MKEPVPGPDKDRPRPNPSLFLFHQHTAAYFFISGIGQYTKCKRSIRPRKLLLNA